MYASPLPIPKSPGWCPVSPCRRPPPGRAGRALPRGASRAAARLALLPVAVLLAVLAYRVPAAQAQEVPDAPAPSVAIGAPSASDPSPADAGTGGGGGPAEALRAAVAPYLDAFRQRLFEEARRELDRFWEEGLGGYAARLGARLLWATLGATVAAWDAVLPRLCFTGWRVCQHTDPGLTYANPGVVALHGGLRRATNLALAAVLLLGGLGVAAGRALGQRVPDAAGAPARAWPWARCWPTPPCCGAAG